MISTPVTLSHTDQFPLTLDFALERGDELTTSVEFDPPIDFQNKGLVWLIEKYTQPLYALPLSADTAESRLFVVGGTVHISLLYPLSRLLKPFVYRHALVMTNNITGQNTTLLVGELRVVQSSRFVDYGEGGTVGGGGATGTGDKTYQFKQQTPATEWIIHHNLNKKPSITITDSAGTVIGGEMQHIDFNTVVVRFSTPFSGEVYLN